MSAINKRLDKLSEAIKEIRKPEDRREVIGKAMSAIDDFLCNLTDVELDELIAEFEGETCRA